jgi:molybdopterin-containing oxidoreductase family membrane subunit
MYFPSKWDWMTLFGSVGLFLTLLFLFLRVLPAISMTEVRAVIAKHKEAKP